MERIILHIDFDSFFASVEQQYAPPLRGKPIGITATNGRTCIIAASREAKRFGIKSPSSTYDAKKICPSIQFVQADFVKYFEVSKKFLEICKCYSPLIEVFSIDELFIDITGTATFFGGVTKLIENLKHDISQEIGPYVSVSIGISYNKLLAKLASGKRKPNGIFAISRENLDEVYSASRLTDICGIGRRIAARLNQLGIYHLLSLRKISKKALIAEFGPAEATFLKKVAYADDTTPIVSFGKAPEVKSVGRNYCLPHNEYNQTVILKNVFELCEEIAIKLRRLKKKARTVGLSLRGTESLGARKTTNMFMDSGRDIFGVCNFFYKEWHWGIKNDGMVRQISVWAENILGKECVPVSLFEYNHHADTLVDTIDTINERFGHHTIRNGFLLYADKFTTVPNGFLGDRWERAKLASSA